MESEILKQRMIDLGASLVGIADLSSLDSQQTLGMNKGVAIALAVDQHIIKDIAHGPTVLYHQAYKDLNERLDKLADQVVEILKNEGYQAYAQTKSGVEINQDSLSTRLPHKTVATLAGLGWIGKCALLVTPTYGSAIRLTSVLTNAPLNADSPKTKSQCADCNACVRACPGVAVEGKLWRPGLQRDELYDAINCKRTAKQLSAKVGIDETLCGKCIEVCPYTQKYIQLNHE